MNGDTDTDTDTDTAVDSNHSHLDTVIDYDNPEALRSALQTCVGCLDTSSFQIDDRLDVNTSVPQNLESEMARLEALKSYRILDTEREQGFERLTALTARIFSVPISLVSLVDLGRQWFMSNRGLGDVRETPRNVAFCAHAIHSKMDVFIVPDATKDVRFSDSPLVTGSPNIRFYAGAPIITPDGYKLGTLCIIDTKPRPAGLDLAEKQNLRELSGMVMDTMQSHKQERDQLAKDKERLIACTSHDLLTPLTCILLNLSLLKEDEHFKSCMDKSHQDLLTTAINCTNIVNDLCHNTIQTFRAESNTKQTFKVDSNEIFNSSEESYLETNDTVENTDVRSRNSDNGTGKVVISQLIKNIQHVMESYPKKVPLTLSVEDDVPPVIISNALGIFRSALNILTNACRLTVSGSIAFKVFVKCGMQIDSTQEENRVGQYKEENSNNSVVFECVDTGPGVNVEDLKDLFHPFGGAKGRTGHEGSLGLGLFSVARHIKGLGGDYGYRRMDSNEKSERNGSVFWFSVPMLIPENSAIELPQERSSTIVNDLYTKAKGKELGIFTKQTRYVKRKLDTPEFKVRNEKSATKNLNYSSELTENDGIGSLRIDGSLVSNKIGSDGNSLVKKRFTDDSTTSSVISNLGPRKKAALVIDDSKIICKVFQKALSKLGFKVKLAENGLDGMKKMQRNCFDIVFCDFLMPIMDGLDCVQQYREWERLHQPLFEQYIIGISAHSGREDSDRGLKVGMNKFYPKPIRLKTLTEIVESPEVVASSERLDKLAEIPDAIPFCFFSNTLGVSDSDCSLTSLIHNRSVCLIADESTSIHQAMAQCLEIKDWGVSVVTNGEDALRLLKMRNWNVVFLNNHLPLLSSHACITKFRKWEAENRIARQNKIYIVMDDLAPNGKTMVPIGFDGVINKPFKSLQLYELLDSASNKPTIL